MERHDEAADGACGLKATLYDVVVVRVGSELNHEASLRTIHRQVNIKQQDEVK